MSNTVFKKFKSTIDDVNKVQDNLAPVLLQLTQLFNSPLKDVRIAKGSTSTGATIELAHNLNKSYSGWILIDKDANVNIWRSPAQPNPERVISFETSGQVNFSVLIF